MQSAAAQKAESAAPSFDPKDLARYSISRAIAAAHDDRFFSRGSLELEMHRELERCGETRNGGFYVPREVVAKALGFGQRSEYLVGTAAQGGNLVQTYFGDGIIQLLRNMAAVLKMGATVVDGLVGNVAIPQWAGTVTASWLAEAAAVGDTEGTVNQIASSPKTIAARSTVSRLLMKQSTPSIDTLVMTDLARALAVALDYVAINGTGASNQPTGILSTAGIGSQSGATLTYPNWMTFTLAVIQANGVVNGDSAGYIMPSAIASLLMQRQAGVLNWPIWDNGTSMLEGTIDGLRAVSTEQVPSGTVVFGDFSMLTINEWGPGLEIAVNPFQTFATGDIGIRGFLSADIVVRHAASFAKLTGTT